MNPSEKFWNKNARKYAKGAIKDMEGYERTLADTRRYLNPDQTVLEFGCGTGTTALKLAPAVKSYTGTDISSEMMAIANEKKAAEGVGNVTFVQATLEDNTLKENSYDVILGYNIVHLLPDPAAALQRIRALLKPDGLFISKTACLRESRILPLIVPAVAKILGVGKVHLLSVAELEHMITAAGFDIIDRHTYTKSLPREFVVGKKSHTDNSTKP